MKKKGFTLAELLGVIVIISLLLLIIIPTIINGIKNKEEEVAQTQSNIIFEATREYLDLDKNTYPNTPGNVYCITLKQLIEAGKLVDPVKKIVEDGDYDVDNYTIEVRISSNGVRKYTAKTKAECQNQTSKNIEMVVSPSNNKWSKEKTVTIYYPNLGEGHTLEYKIDDGPWQQIIDSEIILTIDKNSKVEARMTGKTEINKKITVEKIDKLPPVILSKSLDSWNNDYKQQVNIVATDAHSGVGGYCIKQNTTKPEADDSCFKTVRFPAYGGIGTIAEFLSQGTYYIFIKDRVGNISGYDETLPDAINNPANANLTFKVEDNNPPTCEITVTGTKGNNNWYTNNEITVNLSTNDDYSGIKAYGLTTSNTPLYNSTNKITLRDDFDERTYYGYVEDKAGNTKTCNLKIKKDSTKPSCAISITNSPSTCNGPDGRTWYKSDVYLGITSASDNLSGVASYELSDHVANNKGQAILNTDVKDKKYVGTIRDNAGNTGECSKTVSRDITKPIYTNIIGQKQYENGAFAGFHYKYYIYDATSGVYSRGLKHRYNWSGSWGSWGAWLDHNDPLFSNNIYIHEVAWSETGHTQVYTQACDAACNCLEDTREYYW